MTIARTLASIALPAVALFTTACGNANPQAAQTADASAPTEVRSYIPPGTPTFTVTSPDLPDGSVFPAAGFAATLGCTGADQAPTIAWSGAPPTAKSFALTMFDPDAPTGSGFWHWLTWDIPATTSSVTDPAPVGAVAGTNTAGVTGYLGPCPPIGDPDHHYRVSVLALDTPSLGLPPTTPPALVTFTMRNHIVGEGHLTALARR
ncbi:YbhB/YbcL family Raf kinase inhibitor-like protein [Nocardia sp. NPDC057663]|uniref:YbhB/YbcL family Raf kinase inhibitor-like protein n=1 Tax=Nocardia sp. NPDC057663 TaxID=3346201 RepID=UPI00366FF71A